MRVEPVPEGSMVGWHRVADDDGSTVAYCPDATTAEGFLRAEEIRHYLVDRCQRTCQGREKYAGRLRHEPNCPAYDLGLIEKAS
jgi:hypothetical protein